MCGAKKMPESIRMDRADRARSEFLKDSTNCTQIFLKVFGDLNEETHRAVLPLGWALGGGLAGQGQVCGALLGALMILGAELRFKRRMPTDEVLPILGRFVDEFRARHRGLNCPDIAGPVLTDEALEGNCRPMIYEVALNIERTLLG
jgi:C_GCAxxG_C_C family probable redox protein